MAYARAAAVCALVLVLGCVHVSAKARGHSERIFAVFGDWGRLGGDGAEAYTQTYYDPHSKNACPKNIKDPFYITIDPTIDNSGGQYDKKPDDPCVVKACGKLDGDKRENCEGKIQQLQAAYVLNKSCANRKCEFIINTSDNFYALGCNATDVPGSGGSCAKRFESDWRGVYKTQKTSAIRDLVWYSSLGNHDILSGTEGVLQQIAYTKHHRDWYLPARYYAKTIGKGATAINLVVADTSSFIDGYLAPSSDYSKINEEQTQSTPAERAKQLAFLESALKAARRKPGWTIVVAHHPGFSGDQSYFRDDDTKLPESSAWAKFAKLVKKYSPHFYVNGHDHVLTHSDAKAFGYHTQFVTSGAGSFSEPNDGGWDPTTGKVRPKKYLKYSNVRMRDGASFAGNVIMTATPKKLKAEFFSAPNVPDAKDAKSSWVVTCTKTKMAAVGFKCTHGKGQVAPAYSQP